MRGRGGASAALKLGRLSKEDRAKARQKEIDALTGNDKKVVVPSPFAHIFEIEFPLPGEPKYRIRRIWIYISDWIRWNIVFQPLFDFFIMFLIFTNCIFLAIEHPGMSDTMVAILKVAEFFYNLLFTIEVAFKWAAFGFWGNFEEVYGPTRWYKKKYPGYFNDEWNILDFVIVLGGWFSMGAANVSALRVLRVLRPLRNVSHIPKLKQIVSTFFDSLEGLFYVVLLLAFMLLVFGIIGLQLFSGALRNQCFANTYQPTPDSSLTIPLFKDSEASFYFVKDLDTDQLAQINDYTTCYSDSFCGDGYFCADYGENPDGKVSSFDNIGTAFLNCFVSITLDWCTLMFQVMDGYGSQYIWPFFYLLTFLVAFFALNLVLAVVCNAFDEEAAKQFPPGVNELKLRPHPSVPVEEYSKLCSRMVEQKLLNRKAEMTEEEAEKLENRKKQQLHSSVDKGKLRRTRSRSKVGLKFLNNNDDDDEQDDPQDVDVYLAQVALELSRPIHISQHIRMRQFFHNYKIARVGDGVFLMKPRIGDIDNFKDGLVESAFDLPIGKKINVQNIVLVNMETKRSMRYHGTQIGDPLDVGQIDESNYEAYAQVLWPQEGWLPLDKLERLSRKNIEPKNKDFEKKIHKIRLAQHEFEASCKSAFIKRNYDTSQNDTFNNFIMTIILLNALTMSLEWDGVDEVTLWGDTQLPDFLDVINNAFNIIYIIEMCIKHIGFGLQGYWEDSWNAFDGTIVIISVIEFSLGKVFSGGTGGLSALRAFRLFRILRVLRLLNQFDGLRRQMKSIMASVSSVIWLLFLLLLFLFTFGVLGTSLFGGAGSLDLYGDRYGWSNLYFSMLTIFQCITGDSWRSVQADTAYATGTVLVSLYFVTVMVLGSFMLLNIFIAILLTNMTEPEDKRLSDLETLMQWAEAQHNKFKHDLDKEDEMKLNLLVNLWELRENAHWVKSRYPYVKHRDKKAAMGNSLGIFAVDHPFRAACVALVQKEWFANFIDAAIFANCFFLALEDTRTQEEGRSTVLGEVIYITDWIFTVIFILELVLKVIAMGWQEEPYGQTRDWEKCRVPPFGSHKINTGKRYKKANFEELLMDLRPEIRRGFLKAAPWQFRCMDDVTKMLNDVDYIDSAHMLTLWMQKWNKENWMFGVDIEDPFGKGTKLDFLAEVNLDKGYIYDMVWTAANQDPGKKADKSLMIIHFIVESADDKDNGRFEARLCYDVTDDLLEGQAHKAPELAEAIMQYWTFDMKKTKGWMYWDSDSLVPKEKKTKGSHKNTQGQSSGPGDFGRDPELLQILSSVNLDNRCTTAYWSDNWNRLDALVVFFTILTLIWSEIKFLRALRAVRPLRLAIRVPAIKVVVSTLVSAVKPAVFALIFSMFLFYILAILGVNLFSGKFYRCEGSDDFGNDISVYQYDEVECNRLSNYYNWDVSWVNYPFNFDHIGEAIVAIFVIASGDTWHAIMYRGMDAPGEVGGTPKRDGGWYYGIYFVLVMICAGFFAFNFVVSAIVDKFIEVQGQKDGTAFATAAQAQWTKAQRVRDKFAIERIPQRPTKNPLREWCYDIVNWGPKKRRFDNMITTLIVLNTLSMCLQHHNQTDTFTLVLKCLDYFFIAIFTVEAVLKILAFSFRVYWRNKWNQFDFVVVLLSYPDFFLKSGASTSVFRVFRIGRILRLIKKARQLNLLFSTLVYSLPSLRNVGLLLFIIYFIFAVVGVSLFGDVKDPDGRVHPEHRNWRTWPKAMNLLYIGSTGDSWTTPWQGLMDHSSDVLLAAVYNIIFFVTLGLVMLNLFIGVILDTYDQNDKINQAEEKMLAVHTFTKLWNSMDKGTIGHLPVEQFMGILKNTPWPVGFSKPLKTEHENNTDKLKGDYKGDQYKLTRERLELMNKKQKQQGGKDVWIDPSQEEVSAHISRYSVEVKFWRNQKVWVVSFDQAIIAFATHLLSFDVEEESPHNRYFQWLRVYWNNHKNECYKALHDGEDAQCPALENRWLTIEDDQDDDDEEDDYDMMILERENRKTAID